MPSRFDAVVQELSQDANEPRIKKLLVYACHRTWENDPDKLAAIAFADLIKELLYLTPTLDQLRTYLTAIARTLSKPAEYTLVANAIAHHLSQLYSAYTSLGAAPELKDYQQTADRLEMDAEVLRIKKLLYCACKQSWQNDIKILNQCKLIELVRDLHQLTPTPPSLEATLTSIVRTLNRSTEYSQVAERVRQAFAPLYQMTPVQERSISPHPRSKTKPTSPVASHGNGNSNGNGKVRPIRIVLPTNLADVRLEMMKYANPLRAKLLIYSLLRDTLDHSPTSWTILKAHELDDLLRELCSTYRIWGDLNAKLHRIARILPEPNHYSSVADAVLRSLKPHYLRAMTTPQSPVLSHLRPATPDAPTELATSNSEPTQVSSVEDSGGTGDLSEARMQQADNLLTHSK